jgi:hypothetical protein
VHLTKPGRPWDGTTPEALAEFYGRNDRKMSKATKSERLHLVEIKAIIQEVRAEEAKHHKNSMQ